ncbi:hypothetical protein [Parvularcula marina]
MTTTDGSRFAAMEDAIRAATASLYPESPKQDAEALAATLQAEIERLRGSGDDQLIGELESAVRNLSGATSPSAMAQAVSQASALLARTHTGQGSNARESELAAEAERERQAEILARYLDRQDEIDAVLESAGLRGARDAEIDPDDRKRFEALQERGFDNLTQEEQDEYLALGAERRKLDEKYLRIAAERGVPGAAEELSRMQADDQQLTMSSSEVSADDSISIDALMEFDASVTPTATQTEQLGR